LIGNLIEHNYALLSLDDSAFFIGQIHSGNLIKV